MSKPADTSVADRMKHLLSTGTGVDCHFLVGKENGNKELLSAHKSILISASDVFEAMFRFDAQIAKTTKKASSTDEINSPVDVIDIEPEAFKTMLSFIYADDLSGLNGDNVVAVLYAANKYNISGLIKACIDFPMPKLHNIFLAFDQAQNIGQEDFAHQCLELIDQNANNLLESDQFLKIDQHLLCEILGRDQLKISGEFAIWNAALRWADAQCRRNGMECSAANRRAVLGPALDKIRVPLIPAEDFTKHIAPLGVLTDQEVISVYRSYHSVADPPDIEANSAQPALYPLRFSTEHRALLSKSAFGSTAWNNNKAKGNIELKYENFSKFLQWKGGKNYQHSSTLNLAGYKWQMSAFSNTEYGTEKRSYLAVCLQCDCASEAVPRSVKSSLTLRIVSQRKGTKDHCETSSRVFSDSDNFHSWDINEFRTFEYLMDTRNGLYANDTVILSVDIIVDDKPPVAVPPVAVPPAAFPPAAFPPVAVPPVAVPPVAVPPAAFPPVAVPPAAFPPVAVPPPVAFLPVVVPPDAAGAKCRGLKWRHWKLWCDPFYIFFSFVFICCAFLLILRFFK